MKGYIDTCLRICDPLDDARLFDIMGEREFAESLLNNVMATAEDGRCMIAPPLYYRLSRGIEDVRILNDFMLSMPNSGGPVIGAFGTVEPKYERAAEEELGRLADLGACGVVWSPRAQGLFGDDAALIALHRRVHELGMVSVYRSEPYSLNEALWRGWLVARQCPQAPLVISGALSSWDNVQMILGFDGGPENVIYDTAQVARTAGFGGLVASLGADRFVFASGGVEPAGHSARSLSQLLVDAGADDSTIQAIMQKNAERLFRLVENSR